MQFAVWKERKQIELIAKLYGKIGCKPILTRFIQTIFLNPKTNPLISFPKLGQHNFHHMTILPSSQHYPSSLPASPPHLLTISPCTHRFCLRLRPHTSNFVVQWCGKPASGRRYRPLPTTSLLHWPRGHQTTTADEPCCRCALIHAFSIFFCGGAIVLKWARMGSNGLKWTRMDSNGLEWTRMDSYGLEWTRMDSNGLE